MGKMALVMKWYDNTSYEMGMIAFLMKWVRYVKWVRWLLFMKLFL